MGDTSRIVSVPGNYTPDTVKTGTLTTAIQIQTQNSNSNSQQQQQQQQSATCNNNTNSNNVNNNNNNSNSNNSVIATNTAIFSIAPRDTTDACALYTSNSGGSWLCCMPCSWLRKNSSIHKALLTIATLLVTSLLVASPVLFLISSVPEGGIIRNCLPQIQEKCDGFVYSVCDSGTCKTLSSQILSSMDMKVSPCQDFYQYSCGSTSDFSDNRFTVTSMQSNVNAQLKELLTMNTSNGIFEKLGQFFNSCIVTQNKQYTTASSHLIYAVLDELGGYLPPSSLDPNDLTPLLIKLYEINGMPLVNVYVDDDEYDRQRSAIYINLPQMGIFSIMSPLRYYLQKNPESGILEVKNLLHGFLPRKMNEQQRTAEYQNILSFIASLDKLQYRTRTHWTITSQRYNYTRLQSDYPFIQWENLLEGVLSINISDYDVIYVVSPMYLTKLEDLVARFNKRVIHNAILMLYARDVLQILVNTSGYHLNEFCVQLTAHLFSEETSALYIQQFPTVYIQHLTKKTSSLLNRLKNTLASRMKMINWMDDETKTMALMKLKALREQYLIWPSLFNVTYIANNLKKIYVDPDNFFMNVIYRFRQLHAMKRNNYQNFETQMNTYTVNVHYRPHKNVIWIPISLIAQAYLRDDIPEYISYASIGTIFMHAILHGFDLNGINFDANGTRISWLSPESRLGLEARIDCFARQYAKHFLKSKLLTNGDLYQFDWNTTQNENIADVGGFQTAYETWRHFQHGVNDPKEDQALFGAPLTPRQLFFVVAAQMYCIYQAGDNYLMENLRTSDERVNSIVMNSPSFPEAFNCPLGSKMNPAKKCSTW